MYYVRDRKYNRVGIVDTSDATVEYIPVKDYHKLVQSGTQIAENIVLSSVLSETEYRNYLLKARRKLLSMSKKGEGREFFVTYSLNDLDEYLKSVGFRIKRTLEVYDYQALREEFVYVLELEDSRYIRGLLILSLDFEYNMKFDIVPVSPNGVCDWVKYQYPIAKGNAHNSFFKTNFKRKLTLPDNELFCAFYCNDNKMACFISVDNMSRKFLVRDYEQLEPIN